MFPTLFSAGPFHLQTISVCLALAFVVTSFIFWRKGREEHYPEFELFDGFLLSTLFGLLMARVAYVAFNFSLFGFDPLKWVNFVSYGGFIGTIGVVASLLYVYRFALRQKWDAFEILDFWTTGLSLGLVIINIGLFFDGAGAGYPTNLPWGVQFPKTFERSHPVQLYLMLFYGALFWYLAQVEYHYRTFEWYRYGKKTAQTGFLLAIFIISSSLFSLLMTFFKPPVFAVGGVSIDRVIMVAFMFVGAGILYVRSGRPVPFVGRDRRRKLSQFSA